MAITTLDGVLAGLQKVVFFAKALTGTLVAGRPMSLFYLAGYPGAAVAPTPGLSGVSLQAYAGQLPFNNPVAPALTYLARFEAQATQAGVLLLCDRLWHNSGCSLTLTTTQTVSGITIPPRDQNGLDLGDGVYAGVEVTGATGAGTPTLTLRYINQSGVSGQSGDNMIATVASSIAGTFYPINLAAGDTGVRRINTYKQSATWTSGSVSLVLYRIIARLSLSSANVGNAIDALTGGFPRIYDDCVPFLIFIPNTTTTSNIAGSVTYAQG